MGKARVYVILDIDKDFDLLDLLAAQSEEPESPFEIADWSGKVSAGGGEQPDVRSRIRKVDNVIVICGELTHDAKDASDELLIAREENKPYLLLWGRKGRLVSPPASADPSDKLHEWSWAVLEDQLKCV